MSRVGRRSNQPEVHSITAAHSGASEDVRRRMRQYAISMAIRTVCFLGAVVATGPLRWVLVAAALALPYFAVVVANAVRPAADSGPVAPVPPQDLPSIPAADEAAPRDPGNGPR